MNRIRCAQKVLSRAKSDFVICKRNSDGALEEAIFKPAQIMRPEKIYVECT